MSVIIPLPWEKPPLTGNRTRGHPQARAREVKVAGLSAIHAIIKANPEPIVAANVTLHLQVSTRHRRDSDGMFPTLKVCLDALVKTRPVPFGRTVLPDDSWVHVPRAACEIHPPDGGPARMWLELSDIHPYDEEAAP